MADNDTANDLPVEMTDEVNGPTDDEQKTQAKVFATADQWALVDRLRLAVSPSGAIGRGAFLLDFFLRRTAGDRS